jgi:hypothetical protein
MKSLTMAGRMIRTAATIRDDGLAPLIHVAAGGAALAARLGGL